MGGGEWMKKEALADALILMRYNIKTVVAIACRLATSGSQPVFPIGLRQNRPAIPRLVGNKRALQRSEGFTWLYIRTRLVFRCLWRPLWSLLLLNYLKANYKETRVAMARAVIHQEAPDGLKTRWQREDAGTIRPSTACCWTRTGYRHLVLWRDPTACSVRIA